MEEVYSLTRHGGGFTFSEVWDMPINFRRYFIDMIIKENDEMKAKQKQEMDKAKNRKGGRK